MEGFGPRRVGLTTWVVLALCGVVGVVAVAMTAVVVVRLNRQVLASAAELRASLSGAGGSVVGEAGTMDLLQYAAEVDRIESAWAQSISEYRLRYPNSPIYESVATAHAIVQVNAARRPPLVADVHERWAQGWSDRDAALAILVRPTVTDEEKGRANELGRKASDEIRRARNDLRDLLAERGISEQEVAAARASGP
jgi:hypothetical protein